MNDNTEYEGKVLNIDPEQIKKKLESAGATKGKTYSFRRYILDTIPSKKGKWVRLRTDGIKTTLCVKEISSNSIDGTSEWEVDVSNIDTTLEILRKIGLEPRSYQENTRDEYFLDKGVVSIDTWPMLNPYIEIESKSTSDVISIANKLGYSEADLTGDNTEELYRKIGIDLQEVKDLKFE